MISPAEITTYLSSSKIAVIIFLVYIVTALKLSFDDLKTLSVDTITFSIFVILSLGSSFYLEKNLFFHNIMASILMFFVFFGIRIFFIKRFSKEILAYADIAFLSLVPLWIEIEALPLFLILCGAFLFVIDLMISKKKLPFMPCYFLSLSFCLSVKWSFF